MFKMNALEWQVIGHSIQKHTGIAMTHVQRPIVEQRIERIRWVERELKFYFHRSVVS